jgi:hypothetical protein
MKRSELNKGFERSLKFRQMMRISTLPMRGDYLRLWERILGGNCTLEGAGMIRLLRICVSGL